MVFVLPDRQYDVEELPLLTMFFLSVQQYAFVLLYDQNNEASSRERSDRPRRPFLPLGKKSLFITGRTKIGAKHTKPNIILYSTRNVCVFV